MLQERRGGTTHQLTLSARAFPLKQDMTQYQLMKDTEKKNPQHFEVIMAFGKFASSKISNRESNIALPVFFFFFVI